MAIADWRKICGQVYPTICFINTIARSEIRTVSRSMTLCWINCFRTINPILDAKDQPRGERRRWITLSGTSLIPLSFKEGIQSLISSTVAS